MRTFFVTGVAGFIGFWVAKRLLARGDRVVGLDNLNAYYDVSLKEARLGQLRSLGEVNCFEWVHGDLLDKACLEKVFDRYAFDGVIHLAAQAGVRHSLSQPQDYVDSNITGFLNVLERIRQRPLHLVYASSSSVYGGLKELPYHEAQNVDRPVSLYAATKRANELMAHTYSHLFQIPATGLRFFTVYGPWGRPDMAYFKFVKSILEGRPIEIYNDGRMRRDFTYIDDVVNGVLEVMDHPSAAGPADSHFAFDVLPAHRILNIGNHQPVELSEFVSIIEQALGKKAEKVYKPMQAGDVPTTYADTSALRTLTGFAPNTPLAQGLTYFVDWYRSFYGVPS
ncbi:MAG: NAD-dependent epimerase/dehydratase family protein [Bordetella sp.]